MKHHLDKDNFVGDLKHAAQLIEAHDHKGRVARFVEALDLYAKRVESGDVVLLNRGFVVDIEAMLIQAANRAQGAGDEASYDRAWEIVNTLRGGRHG